MITQLTYVVAGALFILSLRWMNSPVTARKGIYAGVAAMVLAVGGTLLNPSIEYFTFPNNFSIISVIENVEITYSENEGKIKFKYLQFKGILVYGICR